MRYGIYGGAFDPFHRGHLEVIKGVMASCQLTELFVVPTGQPVFKANRILTPAAYRYYMLQAVLRSMPNVVVSDIEIQSEEKSYTLHTIDRLVERYNLPKDSKIYWICGADILYEFERWYKPEEIARKVSLIVSTRPGSTQESDLQMADIIRQKYDMDVVLLPLDTTDISSSDIRKNQDYSMLPSAVRRFIQVNDLYSQDWPMHAISEESYTHFSAALRLLFAELSEKRLLHSLNTAILSARYAIRFGSSPEKALIAGLLHDCAKELPLNQMSQLASLVIDDIWPKEMIHGPAGVIYARERYGIKDSEILDAICYHTTGRRNMSGIEKVVYLADKLEPARQFDDLEPIRETVKTDLNQAMIVCFHAVKESLRRKGRDLHPLSLEALDDLQK